MVTNYDLIYSALQAAADLGYALPRATERRPVRVAQRDDGTFYASIAERRNDYGDHTVTFAGPVNDNPGELITVQDNITRMIFNMLTKEMESKEEDKEENKPMVYQEIFNDPDLERPF